MKIRVLLKSVNANILHDVYRTSLQEIDKKSITPLLQYNQYA